jgi:acetate CoA/acetoacetate CoA-transferase beta subunit
MGVMDVTNEGLLLREINPEFTLEQVQEATACSLIVSEDLKQM